LNKFVKNLSRASYIQIRVSKALVPQFQEEITFGHRRIQDLLRMAQLISSKLALTELEQWIEYGLNGYPDIKSVPDYRKIVSTELQYFNPYRGWCIAAGRYRHRIPILQPVTELGGYAEQEHLAFSPSKNIRVTRGKVGEC
jgi:hypothetical protein